MSEDSRSVSTDVDWPTLSLREAGVTVIDCDHRTPPAVDSGYPYVTIPQLNAGRLDLQRARRITEEHFIEWTRKAKPAAHDVVLSRRCNPGESAYVPPGVAFALGQNLVLLRAHGAKIHPPFLRWLVRGPEWWEQVRAFINVGAVFDSLRCADIPKFELRVPPLAEQEAIADVLSSLDDKIALNRRMSTTFETTAHVILADWAQQANDDDSGQWMSVPLVECGTWVSGGTPSKSRADYWGGDIPWISAKSMHDFIVAESEDRLTLEGARNGSRLVPPRAVVFVVRGMSLATEFRVGVTSREVTINQDLKAILPRAGLSGALLGYALQGLASTIIAMAD